MRRSNFTIFSLLASAAVLLPGTGLAQAVLVPNESRPSNLGLSARQSPIESTGSEKKDAVKGQDSGQKSPGTGERGMSTPSELKTPSRGSPFSVFKGPYLGKKKKKPRTSIIRVKDFVEPQDKKLPNVLTISFSDKSTLSEVDAKKISKKLGLTPQEISKNCYLAPHGLLNTDKGTYIFGYNLSHIVNVRYAGSITEYNLRARALCKVGPTVPGDAGALMMIGDRFQIILKKVNCAAPTRPVKNLLVTYTGTDKGTCEYQY